MSRKNNSSLMEKIVSLAKRRGFIYQSSEIYGGLAGTWDYGPLGNELKHNIEQLWWRRFVSSRDDMYGISSSVIMPEAVWRASGHLEGFTDPMVECEKCRRRFRADHLDGVKDCSFCGGKLSAEKTFNLLFPVEMGSAVGGTTTAYLRGELAQGMFVNFKNIVNSFHPKLPFGIAQIGKAFRNEINPRDFLFRVREFDLAEFEYFIRESDWEQQFEYWREQIWQWIDQIGLSRERVHELEVPENDRAHYSKRTIDFEYDYPFGRKELYGLAYRTDYDLKKHMEESGVDISYLDQESNEKIIPHVIEPTFGIGRTVFAILCESYQEDTLSGEKRVFLKFPKAIAPVKAAVFPLLKNKPALVERAKDVYNMIKKEIPEIMFDDNGNIGKRYRRQDEIGTPNCVTVDFDTLEDNTVTVRDRDSGKQKRVLISKLVSRLTFEKGT
ncbi:glycine--tRNA ligase [Patescibacteria group bacterium]|nr:glycine--tRNA ligase [Patescibacteria group bacterium]